ncbi:D-psicose 3-epimerase [Cellulosilyticum sp. I15G10I2]|uniref:D-psicose 3-epimerase n=1 Tax=Cellulosilyticum sp. I15G10I2 TaxID=1892843 RepID=UPI00085C9D19|nr:sugar phosphate isomerase/epimerase family protein [Cellulosilyticum sp. I15G10I2]
MNKIGIHYGYFTENWGTDIIPLIKKVRALGFDILEVAPGPLLAKSKQERDMIAKAANDVGIELTFSVGLGKAYDLSSEDEKIRNNGIDFTLKTFDIMKEMGAKMYSGVNVGAWNNTPQDGIKDKSAELARSVASIKEIMKVAEKYGITYAVEVVNRYEQSLLNTAEEAMEYVKMVDSPNLKVLLDTYHMNIEEDSFEKAIKQVGNEYLGHFHVGESNRKPPSINGRMPWDEITTALKAIHYEGAIVMEPFIKMGGEVGRDIKVWRDISKNATTEEMDYMAKESVQMLRDKMK